MLEAYPNQKIVVMRVVEEFGFGCCACVNQKIEFGSEPSVGSVAT